MTLRGMHNRPSLRYRSIQLIHTLRHSHGSISAALVSSLIILMTDPADIPAVEEVSHFTDARFMEHRY
jgi:hypothetical protein